MKMHSLAGLARRSYNGVNKHVGRVLLRRFTVFGGQQLRLAGLGQGEGAWIVPIELIQPDWICYCFGVGVDASFDLALVERRARVFSFDPTPRSIEYMERLKYDRDRLSFTPVGIWSESKELKFYAPMNPRHANYSVHDIHATTRFFVAQCHPLSVLMAERGHDHVDLLKVDVEGAWFEVLSDVARSGIFIKVLCAEFDTPTSYFRARLMIKMLKKIGLEPVHQRRDNFLFLHESFVGVNSANTHDGQRLTGTLE
jgi:FkbM family methyltransferase